MDTLRGELVAAGVRTVAADDTSYEETRLAHQRGADQHPEAVVWPESAAQVASVLAAARRHGSTVAVQAGGHGASEDLRGSILMRLDAFNRLELDQDARTLTVGAGVRAGDAASALDGSGLLAAFGTSPLVSVIGLAVNGGHSWISGLVGLTAQTVRRFRVVLPDGADTWVDDDTDPQLMRVLRGAGGLAAVVLEAELDLVEAPELTGGSASAPAADGPSLWRGVRDAELAAGAAVSAGAIRFPDVPALPPHLRGVHAAGAYALAVAGEQPAFTRVVELPNVSDGWQRRIEPSDVAAITNDSTMAAASDQRGILLRDVPDELIQALFDLQGSDDGAPVVVMGLRALDSDAVRTGRPTVVDPGAARWLLHVLAPIAPGSDASAAAAALEQVERLAAPWTVPGTIPTFLGRGQTLADALPAASLDAIRMVRTRLNADVLRPTRFP